MIQTFRSTQQGGIPRPIVDVGVQGIPEVPIPCLIDTGSIHNRFGLWVARSAGINLRGVPVETVGIGGVSISCRTALVGLTINGSSWEAPVAFCDPWPWDFNLLGQEGFFRWFTVTIQAADRRLDIRP